MNRNYALLLCSFILFGLTSCSSVSKYYSLTRKYDVEYSPEEACISSRLTLDFNDSYFFLHAIFQSILPKLYENYNIKLYVSPLMDEEDALQYMYIDECRILLPTGKVIYLMDKNITLHYVYYESRKVTGEKYKIIQNVQPQYINNKKIVYMDGVFEGDNAGIIFNANIPSSVNSLQVEYTLTMVWEERGETKQRYSGRFEKESHKYYWFTH